MYTITDQLRKLLSEQINTGRITERKLCNRLCSRNWLYNENIENLSSDIRLVLMLIQRLGKSANKLELIVSEDAIKILNKQQAFNEYIDKDDYEKAKALLEDYKVIAESKASSNIDKMYYFRNMASYVFYALKNNDEAYNAAKNAVSITIPSYFEEGLKKSVASTIELENILAMMYYEYLIEKDIIRTASYKERLNEIRGYILRYVTDDEEIANILPKCLWLCAKIHIDDERYEEAIEECELGIEQLRKTAVLQFLPQLLEIVVKYGIGKTKLLSYEEYSSLKAALDWVIGEYGYANYKYDSWFVNCIRTQIYYDVEIFAEQRKIIKETQQNIADNVMVDASVISNYERGKNSPNRKTFPKIMEALDLDRRRLNTILVDNDFGTQEQFYDINIMLLKEERSGAIVKLNEIKKKLDLNNKRNKLMIMCYENRLKRFSTNPELEKMILVGKKELQEIYPMEKIGCIRPLFSEELLLAVQISNCLDQLGKSGEAIEITENILKTLDNSAVMKIFRERAYTVVITNYHLKLLKARKGADKIVRISLEHKLSSRSISLIESELSSLAIINWQKDIELSYKLMVYSRDLAKAFNNRLNYDNAVYNLKNSY